jgi:hypothetical protein
LSLFEWLGLLSGLIFVMIRPKTYRLVVSETTDNKLKVNRVEYLKKTNQHKSEWKAARNIGVSFINSTDGRVLVKKMSGTKQRA